MGCVGGGINTSRASEGVKDGSASKIGVVSREAIWSKVGGLAESRSYRPWMQFLAVQRLASDCLVTSSIPSVVEDFSARRVFAARLPNPIPTTVTVSPLQNVRPAVDPKAPRRCLPGSFRSSATPSFGYRSPSSRDSTTRPLFGAVPV